MPRSGAPAAEPGGRSRIAVGAGLGILVAFGAGWLIEYGEALLYPLTTPVDWDDRAAVGAMVAGMPNAAKWMIVAGWFLAALLGAAVGAAIGPRAVAGWIPAAMVAIGGVLNFLAIPHPAWMMVAAVVLPLAGGWLGVRLGLRAARP